MERTTRWIAQVVRPRTASLRGETAIVTGARSGIGAATARVLAARGACVVLAARRAHLLERHVRAITLLRGHAISVPTDVTDPRQIANLAQRAIEHLGRIDILVNCAGIGMAGPIPRLSMDTIYEQMATNLLGPILLTRAIVPGMVARRHGVIISVASIAAHVALDPLYSATKFGLRGFSIALGRQLRGTGVSTSIVSPGHIRTAMTRGMRRRLPGPDYVARHIAALVTAPRRELILPPLYLFDVWAERLLPWLMQWIVQRRMGEECGTSNSVTNMKGIRRLSAWPRPTQSRLDDALVAAD